MSSNRLNRGLNNAYSHGSHVMVRLTYVSQAYDGMKSEDLVNILEQAKHNNAANGITGMLVFNTKYFLQCIEGSRPVINDLLTELVKDERHFNFEIVDMYEIDGRDFEEWEMEYFTPNSKNKSIFLKHSLKSEFNPYLMTSKRVSNLLSELSEKRVVEPEAQSEEPKPKSKWLFF